MIDEKPETPDEAREAAEEAADRAEAAAEAAADAQTPEEAQAAAEEAAEAAEQAAEAAAAVEDAAEEEPKPAAKKRASRRKKAEPEAVAEDAEAEADADEAEEEAKPAGKKRGPRRGSAEAGAKKQRSRRPRPDAEPVFVRAQAKYVRSSPRKARLVVDHIRGKSVDEARAILAHTPRAAAVPVLKVLESAIANAEHNHELLPEELRIHQVMVDEGPTIKRFRPRALGRATKIRKRTSHITINLTNTKA
jgi:large subunit ribosomal protein L22